MFSTLSEYSDYARKLMANQQWNDFFHVVTKMRNSFPESAEVFFLFGMYKIQLRQFNEAKFFFGECIAIDETRFDAAVQLANIYLREINYCQAFELIKQYESAMFSNSYYLNMSANLLTAIGCHGEALIFFKKAHELQPDSDTILFNLAKSMILSGEAEQAETILNQLIIKYPHYQKFHYELSKLKSAIDSQHIKIMEKVLRNSSSSQNIFLHYALGKEYEDLKEWDKSFQHYYLGGKEALKQSRYNVNDEINVMNVIMQKCNASWLQSARNKQTPNSVNNTQKTPIFIVGLPRTGTTLIERILASHSAVESADETFLIPLAINRLTGLDSLAKFDEDVVSSVCKISSSKLAEMYINMISYKLKDKPYFIDKYPFNFLHLGLLVKAFPHAKFIYLHRHPMDACFAMYKQSYFKFAYCLNDLSKYYIAHNKLMLHWRELLGERIVQVEYENIVKDPDKHIRHLGNQLNIPFESACLRFIEISKPSATASTLQVRRPIHTKSINKWVHYAHHLKPLKDALKQHGIDVTPTNI